ncbi:MAG: universal stress protein [Nitrospirae bacterium]|nr:universal stress protein [Nitrospirota bacterium]
MKKVLIAVDDTKGSKAVLATFQNLVQRPEEVILLHVERLLGRSLMINTLGEADLSILKEELKDTEYKKELDRKAEKILTYYKKELEESGIFNIKTLIKDGVPAEDILNVAAAEGVELIILGYSRKEGLNKLITGSVARDVEKNALVPVLTAKKPVMCEESYTWRDAYYAVSLSTVIILAMFFLGIIFEKVFLP